jgi:methylated-DNA-[protein]-cysteine S-methyltransferase
MDVRHTTIDSALGEITLAASDGAVSGIYFEQHWHPPTREALGEYVAVDDDPLFERAATEFAEYLNGERTSFDVPIALRGNPFQARVWELLQTIPYGETTTYGALAGQLGDPRLARAVGRAVGQNPVSVIVPCHRVVGHDGKLTGYAGGLDRKRHLLTLEHPRVPAAGTLC